MVRPHVGDTLFMQLEQTIETRNVPVMDAPAGVPSPGSASGARPPATRMPDRGPVREQPTSQTIVMRMFAHSLVEESDLRTTSLTAFTDSLHVRTGTGTRLTPFQPVALGADNRVIHVRVSPEGAMTVADPRPGSGTLDASLSGMPAMLPSQSVAVGAKWERDIPLPSITMRGVRADGLLHAQFHLDSLSHGGRFAHVSMTGTLRRQGATRDLPPGTQVATAGTLSGFLVLDRTRGWITEAETLILVQSDVTPRPGDKAPARSTDIRLLQRMKVR